MHLKSLTKMPPGGWRYTQPETGHAMSGITFRTLLSKVGIHRANQKITSPTNNMAGEVEDAICQALSPEDQVAWCVTGMRTVKSISWTEVAAFLKTAAVWVAGGQELVAPQEAERRAAICTGCPLNVGLHGCGICQRALQEVREKILNRGTSKDSVLQACGVCGCDNKTQVHVPLEVLRRGRAGLQYPAWCWKADGATTSE